MEGSCKRTPLTALAIAEIVSIFGSRMTYLALPWFVLATTGSASKMALVLAAEMLPIGLLGILSGTLVERLGGRTTMLVCDAARAPLLAAVPLLHATGMLGFRGLLALVALLGCFMAPYMAAQRVILPEVVGEDEGADRPGEQRDRGCDGVRRPRGPGARRARSIPLLGAPNVLYLDAATFAVSFLLVAGASCRRRGGAPAAPRRAASSPACAS